MTIVKLITKKLTYRVSQVKFTNFYSAYRRTIKKSLFSGLSQTLRNLVVFYVRTMLVLAFFKEYLVFF